MITFTETASVQFNHPTFTEQSSRYFENWSQAVLCANNYFMQGQNFEIVTKENKGYWVVSSHLARELTIHGYRSLYGN